MQARSSSLRATSTVVGAAIALLCASDLSAQIAYTQDFDSMAAALTPPTGFTGNFTTWADATTCSGTGVGMRRNLYAGVPTGEVGTFLGVSTGNPAALSFDYKVHVWAANTVPATAPWGTIDVQISNLPSGPWTTIGTITDETQVSGCISKSYPFTPAPGAVFFRFNCTRTGGDNWWCFDNIDVQETLPCTGTPNPGNTVGPVEACFGANFTLSLQNNVAGTGVSYQWFESTVSGTGPWTSISGANSKTLATSQTVAKWYYCQVTCASGPSTANSTSLGVPMATTTFPQDWSTGVVAPNCWSTQQIAGTGLPLYSTVSGYGLGTGSVQFNFFTHVATTENALVSPEFAPVGPGNFIQFDAAGAHWASSVDVIYVEESPDGGATWNTIVALDNAQAGGVLNTALFPGNTNYTAAQVLNSHWITLGYPLTAGTNRLRLRGDSAYGNNLYFDNVTITNTPPAYHATVGVGCYDSFSSALVEEFATTIDAKTKLDGNALTFINTGTGYLALWLAGGGAGFVTPSGSATELTITDDGNTTITPTQAATLPGVGSVTTWNVASNGVLTAGAIANAAGAGPTRLDVGTSTGLAFYSWRDWNSNPIGSGKIKWEEIGTTLYVTWDGVYAYNTTDPTTFQFQVETTTGNVTIVWTNYASTATGVNVVGATLAGASITPPSTDLTTATPYIMGVDMQAMSLSVSGRPINNGTPPNYTINNIPEYFPGAGFSGLAVVFGFTVFPGGIDLGPGPFDIGAPGCNGYITPDVVVIIGVVPFGPVSFPIPWSIPVAPAQLWMQAVSEFIPGTLPNGQNVGGKVTSNALEIYIANS